MEEFNFDAPINATVIFDDSSDDETNEKKPSIHVLEIETKTKNDSSIKLHKLENTEKNIKNNLSKTKSEFKELKNQRSKTETQTSKTIKENCPDETVRCTKNLNLSLSKAKKSPKKKQKLLDMPSLEDDDNILQNVNVTFDEFDNNKKSHNSDQQNRKRKKTIDSQKITKQRCPKVKAVANTSDTHETSMEGTELNNNDVQCNKQTHLAGHNTSNYLSLTPDSNTNGPLNETHKELEESNLSSTEPLTNFHLHNQQSTKASNQQSTDARTFFRTLNEINNSFSDLLKDSLNTVSEHIINILKSYLSYVRICKDINSDPQLMEHAKRSFMRSRNHFFDLSYSSVVNIIIPSNAIDNTFALKFIEKTRQMAVSKLLPFTRADIERLYHEMIAWVEKRREQIQKINLNQINNPLLAQELQKPTNPPPYSNPHRETYSSFPTYKQNHFSNSTAPSSQNPSAQSVNKQVRYGPIWYPSMQDPQNSRPMNIHPPPYSDTRMNDLKHSSHINCIQTSGPPRCNMQFYDPKYYYNQAGCTQVYDPILEPPQNRNKNNQNQLCEKQSQSFNLLCTPNASVNTVQRLASQIYSEATPKLPLSYAQSCENQMLHLQKCSDSSLNEISTTPNLFPNHQDMDLRQYNQLSRAEYSTQVEQNRSISRDSGFISPLYFNSNNDQPLQCDSQERSSQATPVITHVTSLNPNVSYIMDGQCTVCGKITKQMCIGCYKCYYCSHDCQNSDWKNHQIVCKIISK